MMVRSLTFLLLMRLRIDSVRRTSITSVLLILVLATSASACVAGSGDRSASSCARRGNRQSCARRAGLMVNSFVSPKLCTATAVGFVCGPALKSPPGNCGVRSFVEFHLVAFHTPEVSSPLGRGGGNIPAPFNATIIVSSVGSPETDRGPPRS